MRSDSLEQVGKVVYLEKKKIFGGAHSKPTFWAITSGKGGVGRSFFTSSLGITLSRFGHRVLMVDCDQNGGTLHSWMGVYEKNKNLSDYYRNIDEISNYYTTIGHEKLCLLSGDTCLWNSEETQVRNLSDLLLDLKTQPFDIVLFDMSSGWSESNAEILKAMDEIFLVTTPEGASIERTYRWIENYILKMALGEEEQKMLCEFAQKRRGEPPCDKESLFKVRNFLEELQSKKGEPAPTFGPFKLIINQARNFEDERLGDSIKSICNKFYFTDMQAAGCLQYDNAVWQCARQRVPVLIHQPFNPLVGQIQGLVKQLVDQVSQRAVV